MIQQSEQQKVLDVDGFKLVLANSWEDGITIKNSLMIDLNQPVDILFTLCPLYSKGDLQSSTIMTQDISIETSRVSGKWLGLQKVIATLKKFLMENGSGIGNIKVVLANKGVLLNAIPSNEHLEVLKLHADIYYQALSNYFAEQDLTFEFLGFDSSEINVTFPYFINPNSRLPEVSATIDESKTSQFNIIEIMNAYFLLLDKNVIVINNNDNRIIIKDLVKVFGINTTFWLVAGYLAFDYKIKALIGNNGIYLSTERFDGIFKIAKLTTSLARLPRIEIKC